MARVGRPARDDLVVARTSFYSGRLLVRLGEVWAADDPIVRHYPAGFRPLEIQRSKPVPPEPEPAMPPEQEAIA